MGRRHAAVLAVVSVVLAPTSAHAGGTATRLSYQAPSTEVGDVAIDQSSYHNDGVLRGGVTRSRGSYRFHRLSADHRYDRIRAPDDPSLSPGTAPLTYGVRVKVKPDAPWPRTPQMALLRHGDSQNSGGDYKLEIEKSPSGVVSATCVMHDADGLGVGYVRGTGGATIDDGHWHRITCSRVAATVSLQIDGTIVTRSARGDLGSLTGTAPILIGCQRQGTGRADQFVGRLDDITITVQ